MLFRLPALVMFALASALAFPASAQDAATHGLSAPEIERLDGKYFHDANARLTPPIRKLLKARYKEFNEYMRVQIPIEVTDGIAHCSGMQAHSGGRNAAFAFLDRSGKLLVVLKTGEKFEQFGARELASLPSVSKTLKTYD